MKSITAVTERPDEQHSNFMEIRLWSISDWVHFLFGALSTSSIIGVSIGGNWVSAYTVLSIVVLVLELKNVKSTRVNPIVFWLIWCIFSSVFGFAYWSGSPVTYTYAAAALSYIPKIFVYIVLAILIPNSNDKNGLRLVVVGILAGSIANVVWAIADAGCYYIAGISITNRVFAGYIALKNVRYGMLSLILGNGTFRSGGLNGDPANVGFYSAIVFLYSQLAGKKRIVLSALAILSLFASLSTLGIVTVFLSELYVLLKESRKLKLLAIALIVAAIIFLLVVFVPVLNMVFTDFIDRIIDKVGVDGVERGRLYYYAGIPEVMAKYNPLAILFGAGFSTSSYGYWEYVGWSFEATEVESVYVSYLFDVGIIGVVSYIYIIIKDLIIAKKNASFDKLCGNICFVGLFCTAIVGFFYHYTLYAPMILLIICTEAFNIKDMNSGIRLHVHPHLEK